MDTIPQKVAGAYSAPSAPPACSGLHHTSSAAEPPPETTHGALLPFAVRSASRRNTSPASCCAMEGFTDWAVPRAGRRGAGTDALVDGRADITMWDAHSPIPLIDAGKPIVVAGRRSPRLLRIVLPRNVRTFRDLKGKTPVVCNTSVGGDQSCSRRMLATSASTPRRTSSGLSRPRCRCEGRCSSAARPTRSSRSAHEPPSCARRRSGA